MTHSPDPSFSKDDENQTAASEGDLFVLPTSFAQQRLWLLDELESGSAYKIHRALRLTGRINVSALEKGLNEIIRRHEALRTTFRSPGGRPVQVIAENISLEMPLIDLSGQPKAEREVEVERLTRDEAMRRFDLVKGPLFNAALIRLSEEEHILLLTMHHIVSDGWSMAILTRELMVLYEAFSNEDPSPLPELPIQYADFAHWQREWLQGEVLENQLSYWRKQLEGVPVLQLFTDRPRPSVQTFAGASQNIALSPTLTGALNDLSQRQGVTLFITLLAAFQTLLFRYTGQEDIVVGSPIANRNRTEIEGLIGFFVNSLAMRTDLSGNPSFLELLGRVREVAFGAYAHQDLPFEKLVKELHPERDMSRTPLFQIMFVSQNMPEEKLQLPGLTLSSLEIESITARFDIEIYLSEKPEGLSGRVVYNTDLFDDATIARLMGHYETLLESIVANPNQRVSDVQILTDAERKQMLVDWNNTSSGYPRDRCVHQLFEQQVEQIPDAVAVVCEDEQLTYRQLNVRSNQLAHYLKKLGVGPEVLVGICLERSVEMVIGLLGILKAGGAYVPLDPSYPRERLNFILNDAQAQVLLTEKRLLDILLEAPVHAVCLDTDRKSIEKESIENPAGLASAENIAYVIYTSGSTGRPKGVCIMHSNAIALLYWAKDTFNSEDLVGVLASTSICFDLSVFELFFPLSSGGKVILAENVLQLTDLPSAKDVTLVNTVPSAIAELLRIGELPESVRTVNLAGEVLKNNLVKRIYQTGKVSQVLDLYGPSEDTTYSTFTLRDGDRPATIGRPIFNTQIYILDRNLQASPIGVAGEMYIGGDGLARGYLNRPGLTAEKFIPNPFSVEPGARIYRTGDQARYRSDGNIEFFGRLDHQVKIRGFRIELGEIELVLGQHPAVEEAVVIAREDVPGDKRLVGYVVASHEPTPTFSELRSFLKEKLPDYMIPTALVFLDLLPLTPNGKVDRRALPVPDSRRPDIEESFAAPRNAVEEALAEIWAEVLRIEKVGIQDNFFEVGGHSLMATQIISRLSDVFQVEIPLRQLFLYPTIAELALIIAEKLEKTEQENVKQLLDEFEDLSDEEAERLLAQELRQNDRADRSEEP